RSDTPSLTAGYDAAYSPARRLGRKLRAAHAHAPARVLPQLLARVQMAERARHGAEIVLAEALRNVGIVERLLVDGLQNLVRQGGDLPIIAGNSRGIRRAVDVVLYFCPIGIGIGDALVIFARNALRYRGIDADLGAGRNHAVTLGQAGVERLGTRVAHDHHVLVALHARGDRPLDLGRIEHVDVVVDHHHVLEIHDRERGEQRVLRFARLLLDRYHRVPERAAAE